MVLRAASAPPTASFAPTASRILSVRTRDGPLKPQSRLVERQETALPVAPALLDSKPAPLGNPCDAGLNMQAATPVGREPAQNTSRAPSVGSGPASFARELRSPRLKLAPQVQHNEQQENTAPHVAPGLLDSAPAILVVLVAVYTGVLQYLANFLLSIDVAGCFKLAFGVVASDPVRGLEFMVVPAACVFCWLRYTHQQRSYASTLLETDKRLRLRIEDDPPRCD